MKFEGTEGRCRMSDVRCRRTEDRCQMTEGRRQRAEDRGRKTEGGRQRAEDRGRRSVISRRRTLTRTDVYHPFATLTRDTEDAERICFYEFR